MNTKHGTIWPNRQWQEWGHKWAVSAEKMAHTETFWVAAAIVLIFLGVFALSIFGGSGPSPVSADTIILNPMY